MNKINPCILALVFALNGCGSSPVHQASTQNVKTPQKEKAQAPNFGSHMAASLSKIAAARRARVIYAVFGGSELADAKTLQKQIVLGFHDTPDALKSLRAKLGKEPPTPLVITSPNDESLPVSVAGIETSQGGTADKIKQAQFVAFLRYVGPENPDHSQLWASALAAALVASEPNHVVIDMATREGFESADWRSQLEASDWLSKQVRPGALKNEDGTVTFFTQGMMKFGRPDLEESNIPPTEARQRFKGFTEAIQMVLAGEYVSAGQTRNGLRFSKCTRPAESIEHACVHIQKAKK